MIVRVQVSLAMEIEKEKGSFHICKNRVDYHDQNLALATLNHIYWKVTGTNFQNLVLNPGMSEF